MAAMPTNPRTKHTTRKCTTAAEIHWKLARSLTKMWKTPCGTKPTKTRQQMAVRATLLNIPKWALCRLYKKSGSGEMRLMVWSWSDMIRNSKGVVGWDRHVIPNILREHNWGVPSAHINFIYYVTYILEYLIMLQGHAHTGMYTILYLHAWELLFPWSLWEHLESHLGSTGQK